MSRLLRIEARVQAPGLSAVVADSDVKSTVNALVEAVAPLLGQHQNRKEAAVRWADLEASGFDLTSLNGGLVIDKPFGDIPQLPAVPAKPKGVHVEATFKTVMVFFDPAGYTGHSLAEIWRAPAFKGVGDTIATTRADAIFAGSTTTIAWSQTALPLDKWRYWVRFVDTRGTVGPFDSEEGTAIEVPASPSYLIDKISGEIRQSDLYKALGDKIQGSHDGVVSHQEILDRSYTFRIDTGKAVHGFGLAVDENDRSLFLVRADRFAIAPPQLYDVDGKPILDENSLPFIVDMTDPMHPKVLIRNAYIDKAYIEELVASKITADYINTLELNAVRIRGGTIVIGNDFSVDASGMMTALNANMRGVFMSSNFVSGVQGYRLLQNGVAEFQNGIFRGTIYGNDGEFHGTVYAEKIVGGVFARHSNPGNVNAASDSTAWRTASSMSVTRGMGVPRFLKVSAGAQGSVSVDVESGSSGSVTRTNTGRFAWRLLRDGVITEASGELNVTATATSNPGQSAYTATERVAIGCGGSVFNVPADNMPHNYDLQFRVVVGQDTFASSDASDAFIAELYIDNGDLA